jgi:hypothetical protein
MPSKYLSIGQGLPETNVLLVLRMKNHETHPIPIRLTFFNGEKFSILGSDAREKAYIETEHVSGYLYILDTDGNRVKAF